jgi:hypothetical protein
VRKGIEILLFVGIIKKKTSCRATGFGHSCTVIDIFLCFAFSA